MMPGGRDLARDWAALAADIERDHLAGAFAGQDPRTLRWCAGQLRDQLVLLAHLAADWDAQAAEIERSLADQAAGTRGYRYRHALVLRQCAEDLRKRLAGLGSPEDRQTAQARDIHGIYGRTLEDPGADGGLPGPPP